MDPPISLWDLQQPLRSLYIACVEPVCRDYGVTRTELDILLFLAKDPQCDTAAEIVNRRYLAKSHVSTSLRSLERGGFLTRHGGLTDRRRIHLSLSERAAPVVRAGQAAQAAVLEVITAGLDREDRALLLGYLARAERNIRSYLEARKP